MSLVKKEGEFDAVLFDKTKKIVEDLSKEINPEAYIKIQNRNQYNVGDSIVHKTFGVGTIIDYNEQRKTYKVNFNGKVRFLLAEYKDIKKAAKKVKFEIGDIIKDKRGLLFEILSINSESYLLYDIYNKMQLRGKTDSYFELVFRPHNCFLKSSKYIKALKSESYRFYVKSFYHDHDGDLILRGRFVDSVKEEDVAYRELLVSQYTESDENDYIAHCKDVNGFLKYKDS